MGLVYKRLSWRSYSANLIRKNFVVECAHDDSWTLISVAYWKDFLHALNIHLIKRKQDWEFWVRGWISILKVTWSLFFCCSFIKKGKHC